MSKKILFFKIVCLSLIANITFAAPDSDQSNDVTPNESASYIYCPTIESLVRDDVSGKWSAPGGWFSEKYSFAKKIDNNLGAAFIGNDIGRIECYFTSNQTGDERIVLKNTKLMQLPEIDVWQTSDKNKNVKVCKTNADLGCPFLAYNEVSKIDNIEDAILNMPK